MKQILLKKMRIKKEVLERELAEVNLIIGMLGDQMQITDYENPDEFPRKII